MECFLILFIKILTLPNNITLALISAGSALVGVVVSAYIDAWRNGSEEERWYANYFLPRKFDALHELYASILDVYVPRSRQDRVFKDLNEYKVEVADRFNAFTLAHNRSAIYLSQQVNNDLSTYTFALIEAGLYLGNKLRPMIVETEGKVTEINFDWPENLPQSYEVAKEAIATLLNPKWLSKYDSR